MKAGIEFEPRDLWLGIYWRMDVMGRLHLYLGLVPMFPIHVMLRLR